MALTDKFLQFARVILLEFTEDGKLTAIHPANQKFCGWGNSNLNNFRLQDHYLAPNQLNLEQFLEQLAKDEQPVSVRWITAGGELSAPYPTFWQRIPENGRQARIQAMIYLSSQNRSLGADWLDKRLYYQALHLPGLIHNINGPLGTIFGRTELLNFKHPEIPDFEEIIRVGYHLQEMLNTFRSKVTNEKYEQAIRINLNRFLDEEISFLNSDLFFKHKVEKVMEFCEGIPEFYSQYAALSGLISEGYHFFRQFVQEDQEYLFLCRSFQEENQLGFKMEFEGPFLEKGSRGATLPVAIEGGPEDFLRTPVSSLDGLFISRCLSENGGTLVVRGDTSRLTLAYRFQANTTSPSPLLEQRV